MLLRLLYLLSVKKKYFIFLHRILLTNILFFFFSLPYSGNSQINPKIMFSLFLHRTGQLSSLGWSVVTLTKAVTLLMWYVSTEANYSHIDYSQVFSSVAV